MATHHELQIVRARCERVDDIIHRQAHRTQLLSAHIRHTTIRNKIHRKAVRSQIVERIWVPHHLTYRIQTHRC